MHIHILGICGTFMGGVAAIARESGIRVTGCDANVYPPMSDQLRSLGIDLIEGFGADQLALAPDIFVIGNVVTRGNPLMEAILDSGARYVSGPQWLAETVLHQKWVLAVAGTHGKTTTASLLTWILEHAGHHPGFLIGGVPNNFDRSARLGNELFVIEADEYDTAFFDKRSKFVHYRPRTAILNNLEYDHADIFPDLAAIETQFHHLVRTISRRGLIIANGAEASLARVLERGCWSPVELFNLDAGWHDAHTRETATSSEFDVVFGDQVFGRASLTLSGVHNRLNAIAAIAAARHAGVPPEQSIAALNNFAGVKRRLELRGEVGGVAVIDDFAHHPTAISTTIAGLRARIGRDRRILAILEPRSNTMKQGAMKALLATSLADADRTFCYAGAVSWDVGEALAPLGRLLEVHRDLDALVRSVVEQARAGDQILVMSNGGFGGIHNKLLTALGSRMAS